jgi:hypothetical protein
MGKQVRFYMLPDDERDFLDFVFQRPSVKLLLPVSETRDLFIKRADLEDAPGLPQVYLWDPAINFEINKIEKIHYKEYDENLGIYTETGKAYFTLTEFSSAPIIVYSRSYINCDAKLTEGRIWAELNRIDRDKMVPKEQEFISWYEEIAHWLRQNLKRVKELNAYVSRRALEWSNKGGEFY